MKMNDSDNLLESTDEPQLTIWMIGAYADTLTQLNLDTSITFLKIETFVNGITMYEQVKETIIAGEDLPDLILIEDKYLTRLVEENPDLYVQLSNYFASKRFQNLKLGEIMQEDGSIYGMPFSGGPIAFYYRKDVLESCVGYEHLKEKPTWDDLIEIGMSIKQKLGDDFYLMPAPSGMDIQIMMKSRGLCFYDGENVTAEGSGEVISLYEELAQKGLIFPEPLSYEELNGKLDEGKILGMMGPPCLIQRIEQLADETHRWDVIRLPKSNVFQFEVYMDGLSWLARVDENDVDKLNLVNWFLNDYIYDNMQAFIEHNKIIPVENALISACKDLEGEEVFDGKNVIYFLANIGKDIDVPMIARGAASSRLSQFLAEIIQKMLAGEYDSAEAYAEFLGLLDKYLSVTDNGQNDSAWGSWGDSGSSGGGSGSNPFPTHFYGKLEIIRLPHKTVYCEEQFLDLNGIEVCFSSESEGVMQSISIKEYSVNINRKLQTADKEVQILYIYHGVTYSTSFPIIVRPKSSKRKNKHVNNFGDYPKVNLLTGNVCHTSADFSLGANRNNIAISHVYNSDAIDFYSNLNTGVGNGWKLNIQQYILKLNDKWFFVDAEGYMHEFSSSSIEGSSNIYQDTGGEGLTLYYPYCFHQEKCYLLKDSGENFILFDAQGRMVRMIPAPCTFDTLNTARAIKIEYDEVGHLKRVYDTDHVNTAYLLFEYVDEHLKNIVVKTDKKTEDRKVTFEYDTNGNLTSRRIGDIVESYGYTNTGSCLSAIISEETKAKVEINYNGDRQAEHVSTGCIGENGFVEKNKNTFKYKVNRNNQQEDISFETSVTNEKRITIVYMFNSLGELVSSFEQFDGGFLKTLQIQPGQNINLSGTKANGSINGYSVEACAEGADLYSDKINLCRTGEEDQRNFAVYGYIRLDKLSALSLQAVISYTFNSKQYTCGIKVDQNATGVWQKISIPLRIPNSKEEMEITNFRFGIYDQQRKAVSFSYSEFHLTPCPVSSTVLTNKLNKSVNLEDVRALKIESTDSTQIRTIGQEITVYGEKTMVSVIPITHEDLLETAKSLYRNRSSGKAELYLNGGKIRYSNIKDVTYLDSNDHEFKLIDWDKDECSFALKQYSADNDSVTTVKTSFRENGILTETTITSGKKSSTSKEFSSYDGRKLHEDDAYKVRTVYEYDRYYNLTKVSKVTLDSSEQVEKQMILSQVNYDAKGEYVENSSSGFSSTAFVYNEPFESVKQETQRSFDLTLQSYSNTSLKKDITYDANGRVTTVSLNASNEIFRNEITYQNGAIRTVSDGNVKYGVKYDSEHDAVEYTVFDGEEENTLHRRSQQYDSLHDQAVYHDEYYRGAETDTITAATDRYGRVKTLNDGEKTVNYKYADEKSVSASFDGYAGAHPIWKVTDPYEGKTYTYHYNYDGKMCGWSISDDTFDTFEVQQISSADTKYTFGASEKYKTHTAYDEKVLSEPRITGVNIYKDTNGNAKDDWTEISLYKGEYAYDKLGRVIKKSYSRDYYEYQYLTNVAGTLSLPNLSQVTHAWLNSDDRIKSWEVESYSYDGLGNLVKINNERTKGTKKETMEVTYAYDAANRLQSEVIKENDTTKIARTLLYFQSGAGKGKLREIINRLDSTQSQEFTYNGRGQIASYEQNNTVYSYTYDNYGNVTAKKRDDEAVYACAWTRGNLLKQIEINGKTAQYEYNHKNVRFRKTVDGVVTTYYHDGGKILGEDRVANDKTTKIRYFYDHDGLLGFTVNGDAKDGHVYRYVKDARDNITGIINNNKNWVARYEYDSFGNTVVKDGKGKLDTNADSIGNLNPFRWKSHYYDVETGFYNVDGRYYEIERGCYIDALEAPEIEKNAYDLLGLDRNGLMCLTLLALASNPWTIATALSLSVDLTYDPEAGYTWWDKHGLKVLLHALSIVVGVIMLATGNPGGVLMILSGTIGLVGELFNEQLAGAMGKAMLGIQTILIGLKSLSCCTPFGLIAMAVGAACVAFATAEAQESLGYGNWMKDAGMSDGWYTGLMTAANVAAIAINFIGPKCFKEGTLVLTEDGYKKIEEIEVGDKVLAYDEETGKQGYKEVVRLFRNETKEWYHVRVADEEIVCTAEHPFFVAGLGFVTAKQLKVSQKLLQSAGKEVIIEAIEIEHLENPETTYNFEVKDFHTYYVTETAILVHNACVAKDGDLKAIVNESNESEAPHAHILKNGRRVSKLYSNGKITGSQEHDVMRFIKKNETQINEGIFKFYPKK